MRGALLFSVLLSLVAAPGAASPTLSATIQGTPTTSTPTVLAVEVAGLTDATCEISLDGAVLASGRLAEGSNTFELPTTDLASGAYQLTVRTSGGPTATVQMRILPAWLSVIPPLLAIALALVFKDVLISLFLGVLSGALIIAHGNPFAAFGRTVDQYLTGAITNPDHASILTFSLLLGGMVGVISRTGGTLGVVSRLSGFATSQRRGQTSTWLMGLVVFFDDYANTLIVGPTMRPITDRLRISREKLAYIVDSTAAPIASLVPISTWVGYEVGLIAASLETVGSDLNPYAMFVASIPYRFYPVLAIVMVFAIAYFGRDFGPMLKAERRALNEGQLLADGDTPLADYNTSALQPPEGIDPQARNAVLPILTVIAMTVIGLVVSGSQGLDPGLQGGEWLRAMLSNANSYAALQWASLAGVVVAVLLGLRVPQLGVRETMGAAVEGFKSMLLALVVLVLAWSLGTVTEDLHTADFLVQATQGSLSPQVVPVLVFLLSAAIAFATGSSWATMGILFPLVVPVVHQLSIGAGHAVTGSIYQALLLGTVSSVLAGSVWGDHCSPISDTTILSSMASGCDHIAHVRTQLPYAVAVGVLGMVLGDIPTAFGLNPWVSIVLGSVIILVAVRWFGTPVAPPANR